MWQGRIVRTFRLSLAWLGWQLETRPPQAARCPLPTFCVFFEDSCRDAWDVFFDNILAITWLGCIIYGCAKTKYLSEIIYINRTIIVGAAMLFLANSSWT